MNKIDEEYNNPSIIALEQKENEFINTLAAYKVNEQKLFEDLQQGNFNNKDKLLQNLQLSLSNLENILTQMKSMIPDPFNKGLSNVSISEQTSNNLLHQSFSLNKATEIYNDAKVQFETLIGERDNTKIDYNKNKSLYNFWFILSILIIVILILYLKGYSVFDNYYIYGLIGLLIYLYFNIIKTIIIFIYDIFISILNKIIDIIRLIS